MGLENQAHRKENGNRKEELVEKGVDGMDLFRHKPLDIKGCGSPQEGGRDLKNIPDEHGRFGCLGPPQKDDDDSHKSKG